MWVNRDIRGFVLFTTMMVLMVLSLFLLSLLQAVAIDVRTSAEVIQRHKASDELENLVAVNPKSFRPNPACIVKSMPIASVIERLKQHQGCEIQTSTGSAWFLIHDLGIYPCLQVKYQNRLFTSHHWEITLARFGKITEVLQWRHVMISPLVPCAGTQLSTIPLGKVSWRQLRIR